MCGAGTGRPLPRVGDQPSMAFIFRHQLRWSPVSRAAWRRTQGEVRSSAMRLGQECGRSHAVEGTGVGQAAPRVSAG